MPRKTPKSFKCALCQKSLTGEKYIVICPSCYNTFQKQSEIVKKELSAHKEREKKLKEDFEKRIKDSEEFYEDSNRRRKEEFEKLGKEREKLYKDLAQQREKERERDYQQKLEDKEQRLKEHYTKTIKRRDEEIKRRDDKIAELEEVKEAMPPELKGAIGAEELLKRLHTEFPEDNIERLGRPGREEGDIKHQVRDVGGQLIDPSIIYDNKFAKTVTKKDVKKAKTYQRKHNTRHVYIVASNMPKKLSSRLIAEKDGATIIHSSIIIDVIKQLRKSIIELSHEKMSIKDREAKESVLYEYIKSPEFNLYIERLSKVYQGLRDIQGKEERGHKRLWKERARLQDQLRKGMEEITTSINTILRKEPIMIEVATPISTKKKSKKKEEPYGK